MPRKRANYAWVNAPRPNNNYKHVTHVSHHTTSAPPKSQLQTRASPKPISGKKSNQGANKHCYRRIQRARRHNASAAIHWAAKDQHNKITTPHASHCATLPPAKKGTSKSAPHIPLLEPGWLRRAKMTSATPEAHEGATHAETRRNCTLPPTLRDPRRRGASALGVRACFPTMLAERPMVHANAISVAPRPKHVGCSGSAANPDSGRARLPQYLPWPCPVIFYLCYMRMYFGMPMVSMARAPSRPRMLNGALKWSCKLRRRRRRNCAELPKRA